MLPLYGNSLRWRVRLVWWKSGRGWERDAVPIPSRPAVRQSLRYALALNDEHFRKYSELRNHVEFAFWYEAVEKLTEQDKAELRTLVARAWEKLRRAQIQVPHEEHRNLHLLVYSRLDNPFVTGILEAYWEAYESVGLNVFTGGYEYLQEVWEYHRTDG